MEDPTGSITAPADAGTTAAPSDAPSPGPTSDGAVAVESQPSETADATAPTPDSPESAEDTGEPEGTEDPEDQPRNDDERKLSRRERQRLREAERVQQAVADALAQKEREATAAKEAAERQAKLEAAEKARREKLTQFVGTPEALQALTRERDDLNRQIREELINPQGADLDALAASVAQKEAELSRLATNQAFQSEIYSDVWSQIEGDFTYPAATFPELANDPKAKAAYLHAQGGIPGALTVLADTIRASKDREWQAKLDTQAKEHDTQLKAALADRDGWRLRAGGGDLAPEEAGSPNTSGGVLTPERYASMSSTDRAKLRSTAEGRAQIDAMSRRRGAA